jgi:hypothetical protein
MAAFSIMLKIFMMKIENCPCASPTIAVICDAKAHELEGVCPCGVQ